MRLKLTAVYEEVAREDGGGYVAYVEELTGAITQGDTLEETRDNLRDAVEQLLEATPALTSITAGESIFTIVSSFLS